MTFQISHLVTDKVLVATGIGTEGTQEPNEIISVGNMDNTCQKIPSLHNTFINSATGGFIQNEVLICGGIFEDTELCWILGKQRKPIKMAHGRVYSAGIVIDDEVSNFITGGS